MARAGADAGERDPDATEVTLGMFAYAVLVIVDLATTTVLLRGFPDRAMEANGLVASLIENHGWAGLWIGKLAGAALVLLVYALVRGRFAGRRWRRVADFGLVASAVVQSAVVLVNVWGFTRLA